MELCPPTARKSHPNFFAHCKRSTKLKKSTKENIKKDYHPKCAKHHENASHPNGFKLWKTINKMICFNIKTPACKRMIHVCLGKISRLLQDASNSNVQSITSTSKKCHLLVRNTMWTHDSYLLWYVWVTNLWGSDLHLNSIFLQWVPKEAKNKAWTRPENSFGHVPNAHGKVCVLACLKSNNQTFEKLCAFGSMTLPTQAGHCPVESQRLGQDHDLWSKGPKVSRDKCCAWPAGSSN